jgi:peptidoglycan/LPS O-acetylase OafA/YrhL
MPRRGPIQYHERAVSREIASLTSLRGYLAAWVVLGHFWQEFLSLLPGLAFLSPWVEHGHSAVPGFFVLSGWVLAHNYRQAFRHGEVGWLRFLGLRLARLYPVHLAMLASVGVLVVGAAVIGRSPGEAYGLRSLAAQLLLVQAWVPGMALTWNYPAWSISSEWFAYLLFPLAARGDLLFCSPVRALTTTVASTLATVCVILYWDPMPWFELALVVPCFLTGMGVQAMLGRDSHLGTFAPVLASILLLALIASCYIPVFALREFLLAIIPTGIIFCSLDVERIWQAGFGNLDGRESSARHPTVYTWCTAL